MNTISHENKCGGYGAIQWYFLEVP